MGLCLRADVDGAVATNRLVTLGVWNFVINFSSTSFVFVKSGAYIHAPTSASRPNGIERKKKTTTTILFPCKLGIGTKTRSDLLGRLFWR